MRTTIDIDNDILHLVKELAHQRQISLGKIISELARQALTPATETSIRNGVPLFPIQPGAKIVTSELINQLRDE